MSSALLLSLTGDLEAQQPPRSVPSPLMSAQTHLDPKWELKDHELSQCGKMTHKVKYNLSAYTALILIVLDFQTLWNLNFEEHNLSENAPVHRGAWL